jgi:hypothetical protein
MAEDRQTMYDGFSDKGAHSAEWFEIAKNFLKLAFASDRRQAKCPCNRCQNRRMLSEYEKSVHNAKHEFMPNYLVWHKHEEVQVAAPTESDGSDDEDRIDDMIADIGIEYDLGSGDQHPPPEVQNFYRLLTASDEKMHDSTELTVLQAVTCLMGMKSKYNFSNQCYNDIMKLIIDLIPTKHNMLKVDYGLLATMGISTWRAGAATAMEISTWRVGASTAVEISTWRAGATTLWIASVEDTAALT